MKTVHKIDLSLFKEFGPRTQNSHVVPGTSPIIQGRDFFLKDQMLLRFLTARDFNVKVAGELLVYQLEWRQTNVPLPYLQDKTLNLLKKGIIYLHGRCMDGSPIMFLDLIRL